MTAVAKFSGGKSCQFTAVVGSPVYSSQTKPGRFNGENALGQTETAEARSVVAAIPRPANFAPTQLLGGVFIVWSPCFKSYPAS